MKARISKPARKDFFSHIERLQNLNPSAAERVSQAILTTIKRIEQHPEAGHKERRHRKLVVPGTEYVVYYRIKPDLLDIVRILHSKQDRYF